MNGRRPVVSPDVAGPAGDDRGCCEPPHPLRRPAGHARPTDGAHSDRAALRPGPAQHLAGSQQTGIQLGHSPNQRPSPADSSLGLSDNALVVKAGGRPSQRVFPVRRRAGAVGSEQWAAPLNPQLPVASPWPVTGHQHPLDRTEENVWIPHCSETGRSGESAATAGGLRHRGGFSLGGRRESPGRVVGATRRDCKVIAMPPSESGGRGVRVDGEIVAAAYGLRDLEESLRRAGLDPDSISFPPPRPGSMPHSRRLQRRLGRTAFRPLADPARRLGSARGAA